METNERNARIQLDRDGYCVLESLLEPDLIDSLVRLSSGILDGLSDEHRSANRSQGSLVPLADYPDYATLIGALELRRAFSELGFSDPRFSSGYLISKPPGGPPLFWHQDWWGWDDEISYGAAMQQVFCMIYLSDTRPDNGCLRVLPGTHRQRHPLHDAPAAHGEALSRVDNPDHPLYRSIDGEVAVPVRAGDVIIGDARLLHAAHANRSASGRSLLTLWYHPDYWDLPASMRSRIRALFDREGADTDQAGANAMTPDGWPKQARALVADLFPPPVTAVPHPWNRVPDWTCAD